MNRMGADLLKYRGGSSNGTGGLRRSMGVSGAIKWVLAAALAMPTLFVARDGFSQTPSRVDNLVPPKIISSTAVEYPDGAKGDAVVLLVIVVNADGSVRSAKLGEGAEPFATAAINAATAWRFEPATRDGHPI